MPAKPRKIPSYRLHKPTGQAVVRLDGRDHYLGKHGTPGSQEAYHRKVAEWVAAGVAAGPAHIKTLELKGFTQDWPERIGSK